MANAGRITDNLARVRERIAEAAARVGRRPEEITLVAVTKYADEEDIATLIDAGCRDLGESRPQQLWRRAEEFADRSVRWHMIGHLQRNKVARTLPAASLIHSCDSLRLAEAIHTSAHEQGLPPAEVLLEVNISADPAKHGFAAAEAAAACLHLATLSHVRLRGLMAMAGKPEDQNAARLDFHNLRQLLSLIHI